MNVQERTDESVEEMCVDGMLRRLSPALGTITSGGCQFRYRRETWVWPAREDQVDSNAWPILAPIDGEIEVRRTGLLSDGPYGVDVYEPSDEALTVEEARMFAHAMLAAADLVDRMNESARLEVPC